MGITKKITVNAKRSLARRNTVRVNGKGITVYNEGSVLVRSAMPRTERNAKNNYLIVMGSKE